MTRTDDRTAEGATMAAVVHDRFGPPDVLRVDRVPRPRPGPGQVLVRVRAAGLDRGVWHLVRGLPLVARVDLGLRRPRRPIAGTDLAGVVEAVGDGAGRFGPGDPVFGTARGTFAQFAVADESKLARMPSGLTFEEAAAVPVSAQTALHALREQGRVQPGQRVLVLGASGGVGSYAVQLAKAFGARVTGVCTTSKVDLVRSLGADEVLDHTTTDPLDGSTRHDLILDIGGNRRLRHLRRGLGPGGTLVVVGGEDGGRWLGGLDRQLRAVLWSPFLRQRLRALVSPERAEDLEFLTPLLESGAVRPAIDRVVPLEDAAEALRRLEQGRVRGKIVISVDGER